MQMVRITRGVFGISAKRLATEARVSERELQRIELGTVVAHAFLYRGRHASCCPLARSLSTYAVCGVRRFDLARRGRLRIQCVVTMGSTLPEDEPLGRLISLRLAPRENMALHRVARDMGLSPKEAIKSLILAATLDIKPKGERPRSVYRASLTTHLTKGQ
jgi:hypothetical protein